MFYSKPAPEQQVTQELVPRLKKGSAPLYVQDNALKAVESLSTVA